MILKKICRTIIFGITVFVSQSLQAQEILVTPEKLKSLLIERSERLQASKLSQEAAGKREINVFWSFAPTLDLHASQESFKQGEQNQRNELAYGAEAKVNVFNGGRDHLEADIRQAQALKKNYSHQRNTADALLEARSLYWSILFEQQSLKLIEEALQLNDQNMKSAQRRISSGVATESDRFEFEMQAVDLKRELAETKLKFDQGRKLLGLLLSLKPEESLKFPANMQHEHNEVELLKHLTADHDYLVKEHQLEAEILNKSVQKQKRYWWPKLDAFASYNQYNQREREFSDESNRRETAVGIKFTMNLLTGVDSYREIVAQSKEAEAQERLARLSSKEIELHLENEASELEFLHGQVHEAEENMARAEKYYRLTQSEYARGVKNSPDMLSASERAYSSKRKYYDIIREYQISRAHVMSKMGR